MSVRRMTLLTLVEIALVAAGAGAAVAAAIVPSGTAAAIKAAFAHGPGPWKVAIDPATGTSKFSAWPNACQLLSFRELKALVPGTTAFKPQGQHGQILGGGETPKFVLCTFNLRGPYDPPASEGYPPSFIQVELRGIVDAAANRQQWLDAERRQAKLAKKYPDQFALYKGGPNGAQCFWDGNELQCIAGKWNFWVLGRFIANTGDDSTGIQAAFRKKVLVPAAYGLATRMR